MERRCANCGAMLGPNDTFCGECGAPVVASGYVAPGSQPLGPAYQTTPPPYVPLVPGYQTAPVKKRGSGGVVAIAIVAVLAVAALGVGGWLLLGNKGGTGGSGTPTPVAQLTTTTAAPTPTANVAAVKPLTRGQIRKVTNNTDPNTYYTYPTWSSNGKQIAFVVGQGSDYEQHIYTVPASGGTPKQLTSGTGFHDNRPTWYGDADVFFDRSSKDSAGNEDFKLYFAPVNGDPATQLITTTNTSQQYAMADTNTTLLVVADDSNSKLHVYDLIDASTGDLQDMGNIQSTFYYVTTSSSDRYYLIERSKDKDTVDLFMFDSTNAQTTQITNTGGNDTVPAWRAGDRLIAFSHADKGGSAYRLYALTVDDTGKPGQPFRLLNDEEGTYELEPVWSPATNQVAFVSDREGGASNVYVMDFAPVNDAAGWLGVSTVMLSADTLSSGKLPTSISSGARVRAVAESSPASNAGLQQDDVIVSVDGTPIDDLHPLSYLMLKHQPGDSVSLQVYQKMSGKTTTMNITTATRSASQLADR